MSKPPFNMFVKPAYVTRKPLKAVARKALPGFAHTKRCHIPSVRLAFGHNSLVLLRLRYLR